MEDTQVIRTQPRLQNEAAVFTSSFENTANRIGKQEVLQTTNAGTENDWNELGRGLSSLDKLTRLDVVQRLDTMEVCLGFARNNRYCINNERGEQIFYVYEASVCFMRQITGGMRGLVLKMTDEAQQDVVSLHRLFSCTSRCCWVCCNLQKMAIILSSKAFLASIHEVWSCCVPHYQIKDCNSQVLWTVRGSMCHCRCCCCQITFQFLTPEQDVSATVTRSWQGCKEIIGAANSFNIHFSEGLTVVQKLTILSASFLVDLNYFEKQNKCW